MNNGIKQEQQGLKININFEAALNELALENAMLRKDKAILTQQVQALAGMVQEQQQATAQTKELAPDAVRRLAAANE